MSNETGFIHISDLIAIHKGNSVFSVPKNESNDILEKMEQQKNEDKGVAFDLRLGNQYYVSGDDIPKELTEGEYLKINPGQFALLTTYEIFHMPYDLVAFISMRFKVKSKGLVNVSGFQVDPGYNGLFIFSVYNAGPKEVRLRYKEEIFTILFSKTSRPVTKQKKGYSDIPLIFWDALAGKKKISLIDLNERVEKLEMKIRLILSTMIPIAAAIAIGIYELLSHKP